MKGSQEYVTVCERMHQTVADILRVICHTNPPQNGATAKQLVEEALATAMHATRCSYTKSVGAAPGAMAFNRDMMVDVPLISNLIAIRNKRQQHVDESVRRENAKR